MLKLLLPVVEVEFLPLDANGGVGGGASSERPPKDPIVDDRPRRPRRKGGPTLGDDREDCTDFVESFLSRALPGAAKFMDAAARVTCDGEGSGGGVPFS